MGPGPGHASLTQAARAKGGIWDHREGVHPRRTKPSGGCLGKLIYPCRDTVSAKHSKRCTSSALYEASTARTGANGPIRGRKHQMERPHSWFDLASWMK